MSKQYDIEGFMSTPLEGAGARPKNDYHQDSEDNEIRFREADEEYQRLKADFARIARAKRMSSHSRSDSSRSTSPLDRQSQRRATNLPKFRIATFYASDVELWFNQIETQLALHQINDDDERYSLTCAAFSGEVASDVRDVLLQPFRSHKYESLKAILIERRRLTTPERVNKVISGERIGTDIPSRFMRRLQKAAGSGPRAVVGKAEICQAFIRQMPTEFVNKSNNCTNAQQNVRPFAPPAQTPQNNVAQPTETATAQVCYYHQTYGEKARLCSEPCSYYITLGQREVANIALPHAKLLYVADKGHKSRYLIDMGAAVSVLPNSCANGISDANSFPLVAANNSTIHTYGNCKRVVDVGLKREYPWTFIVADVQQPIIGADFLIHYNLLVDLRS